MFSYYFLIISFLCSIVVITFFYHRNKKRKEEEKKKALLEEERLKNFNLFKSKLDKIIQADKEFSFYTNYDRGYFSNFYLESWGKKYTSLYNEIKNIPFRNLHLTAIEEDIIRSFMYKFSNAKMIKDQFNKDFANYELSNYSIFFDNIENRKLDLQQRNAIVINEDNSLIIAGAGSGKTTTIVGKVHYIIQRYKAKPEDILLISFTSKSAATLAERIKMPGLEAKTFHKFGLDVIASAEEKRPAIFDHNQFRYLIIKFFKEAVDEVPTFLEKVTDYFINFLKPEKSQFTFDNQGSYIQYLKDQNFKTYKLIQVPLIGGKTTLKKEVVKSIEECKIANFLLFNNVEYKYELPYEYDTATASYQQ